MEVKTENKKKLQKCYYSINSPQKKERHMMIQRQQKYDHLMYHFVTFFWVFEVCLMKLLSKNCSLNLIIKPNAVFPDSPILETQ